MYLNVEGNTDAFGRMYYQIHTHKGDPSLVFRSRTCLRDLSPPFLQFDHTRHGPTVADGVSQIFPKLPNKDPQEIGEYDVEEDAGGAVHVGEQVDHWSKDALGVPRLEEDQHPVPGEECCRKAGLQAIQDVRHRGRGSFDHHDGDADQVETHGAD